MADPLVLLCRDEAGYGNLLKLVSAAHLGTDAATSPHVSLDRLEANAEGLIALSGGVSGPLGRLLENGQAGKAEDLARRLSGGVPGGILPRTLAPRSRRGGADRGRGS